MRLKPAIFLDRDGTLNYDHGYVHKIADWEWLPGALEGLRLLQSAGYLLVVASNQSGVARGYYTFNDLKELEGWLQGQLEREGIIITAWKYCPHHPDSDCDCRKPKPGMLLTAARELQIDLARSWMIGDKISDIEAGERAGCSCALIMNTEDQAQRISLQEKHPGLLICNNLLDAAKRLLTVKNNQDHSAENVQ